MSVVISLGALILGSGPDGDGNNWKWQELDGWDSPDMDVPVLDLPGDTDRVAAGPIRYKGRALSLAGVCECPSLAAYWLARTKLAAATNLTRAPGTLTVGETATKKIDVYRAGRPLVRSFDGLVGFEFEIPLLAHDPRKLTSAGAFITAPGTATNSGNFRAAWVLTVTGAAAGPIVLTRTAPGATRTISVTTAVPGGQTLVIDSRARSVVLNGVNRYDLVTATPEWFDLEPGANTIGYAGGGTFSLDWNASWI